jgi:hypothetical protein
MYDIDWNRLLSLVVALSYLVIAYIIGGGEILMKTVLFLVLPMAAIWYGDALGDYTGTFPSVLSTFPITGRSPGSMVTVAGWILLLMPIVAGIISHLVNS